jgi:phospholipase C
LQAAGITWKVYRPNDDGFGDALPWFAQYLNAGPGDPLYDRGVATVPNVVAAFRADVTNDTFRRFPG